MAGLSECIIDLVLLFSTLVLHDAAHTSIPVSGGATLPVRNAVQRTPTLLSDTLQIRRSSAYYNQRVDNDRSPGVYTGNQDGLPTASPRDSFGYYPTSKQANMVNIPTASPMAAFENRVRPHSSAFRSSRTLQGSMQQNYIPASRYDVGKEQPEIQRQSIKQFVPKLYERNRNSNRDSIIRPYNGRTRISAQISRNSHRIRSDSRNSNRAIGLSEFRTLNNGVQIQTTAMIQNTIADSAPNSVRSAVATHSVRRLQSPKTTRNRDQLDAFSPVPTHNPSPSWNHDQRNAFNAVPSQSVSTNWNQGQVDAFSNTPKQTSQTSWNPGQKNAVSSQSLSTNWNQDEMDTFDNTPKQTSSSSWNPGPRNSKYDKQISSTNWNQGQMDSFNNIIHEPTIPRSNLRHTDAFSKEQTSPKWNPGHVNVQKQFTSFDTMYMQPSRSTRIQDGVAAFSTVSRQILPSKINRNVSPNHDEFNKQQTSTIRTQSQVDTLNNGNKRQYSPRNVQTWQKINAESYKPANSQQSSNSIHRQPSSSPQIQHGTFYKPETPLFGNSRSQGQIDTFSNVNTNSYRDSRSSGHLESFGNTNTQPLSSPVSQRPLEYFGNPVQQSSSPVNPGRLESFGNPTKPSSPISKPSHISPAVRGNFPNTHSVQQDDTNTITARHQAISSSGLQYTSAGELAALHEQFHAIFGGHVNNELHAEVATNSVSSFPKRRVSTPSDPIHMNDGNLARQGSSGVMSAGAVSASYAVSPKVSNVQSSVSPGSYDTFVNTTPQRSPQQRNQGHQENQGYQANQGRQGNQGHQANEANVVFIGRKSGYMVDNSPQQSRQSQARNQGRVASNNMLSAPQMNPTRQYTAPPYQSETGNQITRISSNQLLALRRPPGIHKPQYQKQLYQDQTIKQDVMGHTSRLSTRQNRANMESGLPDYNNPSQDYHYQGSSNLTTRGDQKTVQRPSQIHKPPVMSNSIPATKVKNYKNNYPYTKPPPNVNSMIGVVKPRKQQTRGRLSNQLYPPLQDHHTQRNRNVVLQNSQDTNRPQSLPMKTVSRMITTNTWPPKSDASLSQGSGQDPVKSSAGNGQYTQVPIAKYTTHTSFSSNQQNTIQNVPNTHVLQGQRINQNSFSPNQQNSIQNVPKTHVLQGQRINKNALGSNQQHFIQNAPNTHAIQGQRINQNTLSPNQENYIQYVPNTRGRHDQPLNQKTFTSKQQNVKQNSHNTLRYHHDQRLNQSPVSPNQENFIPNAPNTLRRHDQRLTQNSLGSNQQNVIQNATNTIRRYDQRLGQNSFNSNQQNTIQNSQNTIQQQGPRPTQNSLKSNQLQNSHSTLRRQDQGFSQNLFMSTRTNTKPNVPKPIVHPDRRPIQNSFSSVGQYAIQAVPNTMEHQPRGQNHNSFQSNQQNIIQQLPNRTQRRSHNSVISTQQNVVENTPNTLTHERPSQHSVQRTPSQDKYNLGGSPNQRPTSKILTQQRHKPVLREVTTPVFDRVRQSNQNRQQSFLPVLRELYAPQAKRVRLSKPNNHVTFKYTPGQRKFRSFSAWVNR